MSKTLVAVLISVVALATVVANFHFENRKLQAEIGELNGIVSGLRVSHAQLSQQIAALQANLSAVQVASTRTACDTKFPTGLYSLTTSTNYGPGGSSEYDIYHVSFLVSEWSINTGMRLNTYGIPTDFYFDYDGDGRIDTALAARFVREIPVAGNTLADRLLANSSVHQDLYSVFSCEWRNAEYTSAEDMSNGATEASQMLWDLVQENSENIAEWIRTQ